ncbi:MAG: hypothetical protein WAL85_10175 [Candidatus Korobacteraceae bacterium]
MTLQRNILFCCLALLAGTLSAAAAAGAGAPAPEVLPAAPQQSSSQPSSPAPDAPGPSGADGPTLSEQVSKDVLEPLRIGIEAQNVQKALSVFDQKELNSYAELQGQLNAFFHLYAETRFRYQLLQVEADKDRGSATADVEMDALPYQEMQVPVRRSVQMRLQLKLEPKGWKVTGFSPAGFFGVDYGQEVK